MLTTAIPPGIAPIDLRSEGARASLAELYRPHQPDWLRLNFVASVSGSVAGSDGTSESLSSRTDRMLLGVIRELSDAVLVGASSVRAEGYFVPRTADLAVVTGSGDLGSLSNISGDGRGKLLVLCAAGSVARVSQSLGEVKADIVPVPDTDGVLDGVEIVAALRTRGYRSLVCEGGPKLATHLVSAGVVDELCLTTSPVINGAALPLFGGDALPDRRLELTQLMTDEAGAVYARWRLEGS